MPQYFFHLCVPDGDLSDPDGQEFADDKAARQEAIAVARELALNRSPSASEIVTVTDEDGRVVHEEPLTRD